MRLRHILALALAVAPLAACGGSHHATLPVDSQIKPWAPPEDEDADEDSGDATDSTPADGGGAAQPAK